MHEQLNFATESEAYTTLSFATSAEEAHAELKVNPGGYQRLKSNRWLSFDIGIYETLKPPFEAVQFTPA